MSDLDGFTFVLTIDLGNDAMRTEGDLATAVRDVSSALAYGIADGTVKDRNGNTVGSYEVQEPPTTRPPLAPSLLFFEAAEALARAALEDTAAAARRAELGITRLAPNLADEARVVLAWIEAQK